MCKLLCLENRLLRKSKRGIISTTSYERQRGAELHSQGYLSVDTAFVDLTNEATLASLLLSMAELFELKLSENDKRPAMAWTV